jgi:type VI secretion system protein ImpJ
MSRDNRIVWNEGMFLGPHHFQQWDRFAAGEDRFRQETFFAHSWGVSSLEFDTEALDNKRLKLLKLEAILPDGSLVRAPAVDPIPAGRQLEEYFTTDLNHLEVFLAVPDHRAGVPLSRAPGQSQVVESRQVTAAVQVEDLNNPGKEMEIVVAHQNLKLLVSGENLDGYITLKIAEIERGQDTKFLFSNKYAPPCLCTGASPFLSESLLSILEALTSKSTALSGQTRQRGGGMVEFGSSDVGNFWLLHTVNSFIPLLADHERTPNRHPHAVYQTLAQLAGALCTFGSDRHPREVPIYDHIDPGTSFAGVAGLIRKLLETVMPSRFASVGLESRDETMRVGEIGDKTLLEGGHDWYLSVRGEMPETRVRDEVPSQVMIGSPHNVDFLVRTANPGVGLTHVSVPPRDFPLKAGCTYFKLESAGETWETIREARAIAIYLGGPELRECSFELIAMK